MLEARADGERSCWREGGWVARVVPVPVGPYNSVNTLEGDIMIGEDLRDVFVDGNLEFAFDNFVDNYT